MPFYATIDCAVSRRSGNDVYGQPAWGASQPARCSIVKFDLSATKTSVRTDSSASRGNAREIEAAVRLLFPSFTEIAVGDRVQVLGANLRVLTAQPRYDIVGNLDHHEVDLEVA